MERVKPETVIEILKKHNVDISVEQAAQILDLLRKFASIVVSQHLENQRQSIMPKADLKQSKFLMHENS
jgi:hypothetical protein